MTAVTPPTPQTPAERPDRFVAGYVLGWMDAFVVGYRIGNEPTTAALDLRAEAESETFEEGQSREVWTDRACTFMAERLLREEVQP